MEPPRLVLASAAALAIFIIFNARMRRSRRLPPGPRGLPVLGNMFDVPTEYQWLTFSEWARKFGDIMSVQLLGHTIVILDSARAVREVLVKHGAQTSGKMRMVMLEHSGWDDNTALVPPETHLVMRRFVTKFLGQSALSPYLALEDEEVTSCITRILHSPGVIDPENCLKRMAGSIIMRIAYGYKIESDDDELVNIAQQAADIGLKLSTPGWILDTFPWLRFLPGWMLGQKFVQTVARSRALIGAIRTIPVEWTKKQITMGKASPSLAAEMLALPEGENTPAFFAMLADLYIAGIDTTLSVSRTLFLVLALYPDVQAKAQFEVDSVTGGERLPTPEDRPNLPYVAALVKELYRFRGVVNLGLPHCATQDLEYNGYLIPKGAVLLPNIWAIFHDPVKYPNPSIFSPERFMEGESTGVPDVTSVNEDPGRYVFGFGPRICPGRYIADSTIFLLAARVLATCEVSHVVNGKNEPMTSDSVQYTGGLASRPLPYKCTIIPRKNAEFLLPPVSVI